MASWIKPLVTTRSPANPASLRNKSQRSGASVTPANHRPPIGRSSSRLGCFNSFPPPPPREASCDSFQNGSDAAVHTVLPQIHAEEAPELFSNPVEDFAQKPTPHPHNPSSSSSSSWGRAAAAAMGNSIYRFLCGVCSELSDAAFTPHGAHDSVAALGRDILNFQRTKQVPEGLSRHVVSSQNAQANWYKKLQVAWKKARPTPTTPEDAAQLVVLTLKNHQKADVEGFLAYYGLPHPNGAAASAPAPSHAPAPAPAAHPTAPTHKPVKAELHTLPVDAKAVADGDTVTVYVDVSDRAESGSVPADIKKAAAERTKARAARNYPTADALQKTIADAGYRQVPNAKGQEVLARKYRIRLSGIDAPESSMPYGKEAKEALLKLVEGKCLTVHVYDTDRYGRSVGDLHAGGVFVQEQMLKKGFAWHYAAYDKRPELAKWQSQAQAARKGLWASKKPQEPWEYRKAKRNGNA